MKAKLNYFNKLSILFLLFATHSFSQNITNTLGTSGVFSVKDVSGNFLTLSQSNGRMNILKSLRLENTTNSNIGIIFKGTNRFLHNYGTDNTFLGINSGNFTMTGGSNTAVGLNSLGANTSGYDNTSIGMGSLSSNTIGAFNTAVGKNSLLNNTDGSENTAIGFFSLNSNTIGVRNTAIGSFSLSVNDIGNENTAIGYGSIASNTSGYSNTALGNLSLVQNSTGFQNTAVGMSALGQNISGSNNTALGNESLLSNFLGGNNTSVGFRSLSGNQMGSYNTAVGYESLLDNQSSYNTALGYISGSTNVSGQNLTCIGYNSQPSSGAAINEITLGNNQIGYLRCNVQTITALSDERDKKNIKDLSLGIDFLMKVKPRMFNWDKREWYDGNKSDGSKMKESPTAGFIAQELDEAQTDANADWLNLVMKDNPEKLEATYGNLLPVMVKAIQELKDENEELKIKNTSLTERQENLDDRLAEVESLRTENDKLKLEAESFKLMNEKILKLEQIVSELTSAKQTSNKIENQFLTNLYKGEEK